MIPHSRIYQKISAFFCACFAFFFPSPASVARVERHKEDFFLTLAKNTFIHTPLVTALAPLPFSHPLVREAIHALKYQNSTWAVHILTCALAPVFSEILAEKRLFGEFTTPLLIPIPSHKRRMRERGYDHTERIARELLKLVHDREIILEENILFRKLDTPSQTTLSQKKRVSMVHGVFAIHNTPEGRDIILLDDVVTTGATLYEASMTLKKAGAKRIFCVSLAH